MAYKIFRNFAFVSSNCCKNRLLSFQIRTVGNNKQKNAQIAAIDEDSDKPIEYLKSEAAIFKAKEGRSGMVSTAPWYQPYVVSFSLAVFFIYFFILREESDLDAEFDKSLYQRIGGLEEQNLKVVLEYNKVQGLPTTDVEQRLKKIKQENTK